MLCYFASRLSFTSPIISLFSTSTNRNSTLSHFSSYQASDQDLQASNPTLSASKVPLRYSYKDGDKQ